MYGLASLHEVNSNAIMTEETTSIKYTIAKSSTCSYKLS